MLSLYNIVSDILYSIVVCIDFLGTHMTSMVSFFRKPGVTTRPDLPKGMIAKIGGDLTFTI
jgi:hypothetical protein